MITSDRLGAIYIAHVTNSALKRKPKHRYGVSLTVAIALCTLALVVFGHGITKGTP